MNLNYLLNKTSIYCAAVKHTTLASVVLRICPEYKRYQSDPKTQLSILEFVFVYDASDGRL